MKASGLRAGVAITAREIAVSVVRRRTGAQPLLVQCAHHRSPSSSTQSFLPSVIQRRHLTRASLSAVLGTDDYHLVQVERPDVQAAELREAVRWRLQDAIDFPVEEATIDIFEMPDTPRRSGTKMLFVVAARTAAVRGVGDALTQHARGFDVIDIPELCLRNLSELLPQDEKGVALMMLREQTAQLVVTRQGVLYLARRIDLGSRTAVNLEDTGLAGDIDTGSIALELQRSLDYYESHFDQTPIGDLVIAPDTERARTIAEALRGETGLRVNTLDCREVLEIADGVSAPSDWLSLTTIGAALRADGRKG